MKEGIEFVPWRRVQAWNVWHNSKLVEFCDTEASARECYTAVTGRAPNVWTQTPKIGRRYQCLRQT